MSSYYRTIVPNGHGGGSTYSDHIVNPTPDGVEAVRIADARGGMVEVSDNGVTGWEFYYAAEGSIFAEEAADAEAVATADVFTVTTTMGSRLGYPAHAIRDTRAEAIQEATRLHTIRVGNGAEGTESVRVEHRGAVVWAIRDNGTIVH